MQTITEARLLRTVGTHVISIGIGNWLDEYELEAIASYPTSVNMIRIESFNAINNIVTTIKDAVCDSKFHITIYNISTETICTEVTSQTTWLSSCLKAQYIIL